MVTAPKRRDCGISVPGRRVVSELAPRALCAQSNCTAAPKPVPTSTTGRDGLTDRTFGGVRGEKEREGERGK